MKTKQPRQLRPLKLKWTDDFLRGPSHLPTFWEYFNPNTSLRYFGSRRKAIQAHQIILAFASLFVFLFFIPELIRILIAA